MKFATIKFLNFIENLVISPIILVYTFHFLWNPDMDRRRRSAENGLEDDDDDEDERRKRNPYFFTTRLNTLKKRGK